MALCRIPSRFFAIVSIVAIAGLMLTGCGNDKSKDDTATDQNTPANSESDSSNGGDVNGASGRIGDIFAGDTVSGTAAADGELISLMIGTPEGGIVTIHLSGEQLAELGFYMGGSFPTAPIRTGDNSPVEVAIEESEGAFTVVYDAGTAEAFFFSFRASGTYTVSIDAGNTLSADAS